MKKDQHIVQLAGVDLAWRPDRNPTAISIGNLEGQQLHVEKVFCDLLSLQSVLTVLDEHPNLSGVAVDAPLIVNNTSGKRACESELSRIYAGRKAGCHSSNLTLYPDSATVRFSIALSERGFAHLGRHKGRWQIECYPHPAIIELFGLQERLLYKKGTVDQKRDGQIVLAELLQDTSRIAAMKVSYSSAALAVMDARTITELKGQALKNNEDALDAIVSLIIAAHYQMQTTAHTFGTAADGYIYVPTQIIS